MLQMEGYTRAKVLLEEVSLVEMSGGGGKRPTSVGWDELGLLEMLELDLTKPELSPHKVLRYVVGRKRLSL